MNRQLVLVSVDPPLAEQPPNDDRPPIKIPVAGPGRPRYAPRPLGLTFWAIPVAIIGATILAILCGALWR